MFALTQVYYDKDLKDIVHGTFMYVPTILSSEQVLYIEDSNKSFMFLTKDFDPLSPIDIYLKGRTVGEEEKPRLHLGFCKKHGTPKVHWFPVLDGWSMSQVRHVITNDSITYETRKNKKHITYVELEHGKVAQVSSKIGHI